MSRKSIKFLTILAILSLIGAATGLPNFGPAQGFSNRGSIELAGDLTVGDDADVVGDLTAGTITSDAGITATTTVLGEHLSSSDDANITGNLEVGGNLDVTGILTTGSTISSGVISEDIQMAAGYDLDCASGASEFDWSLGTGIFKTTSGAVTIGGGTNAITLNGPVTGASAKNWTMVGASLLTIGSLGIEAVGDTINFLDAVSGTSATFSGAVATGSQTVTGGVTATGTIQAEQITSTDDMTVNDDLNVLGDLSVAGTFTIDDIVATDDLTVGDDADVVGDLTAGTITSDGAVTATTTVTGEQITSTDDATIADTLTADDLVSVNDTTVGGALDVDGATTLDGLTVAEAATFSSTVALNDDATLAAGKDLICASGASEINFAAGTGIFTSPSGTNTLQGDVVISEGKDLGMSGNATLTTGTGAITLNGAVGIAAGVDITAAGTGSDIDYALSTDGVFTSPGGTNTLSGDVTIAEGKDLGMSGAATFTTGTGAVSLNGDTTVATAKTLAVTDADALTVGGAIVPQEEVIVWKIDASSVDENIFIAADAWNITHIEEVHAVAGTHGDPVTLMVRVCDGTETPANGDAAQSATIDLKGTANTVQAATLTETITLADGDRIALDYTGDLTALAGGVVTIHMVRV